MRTNFLVADIRVTRWVVSPVKRINFPVAGVFFSGQKDNFSDCRCLGGRVPEPLR